MDLRFSSRQLYAANQYRAYIQARGVTNFGSALWTSDEDAACRRHYPDYLKMTAALPGRTRSALQHRCVKLGIARKRVSFTGREIAELRKTYPRSSAAELADRFPNRSTRALVKAASKIGVRREKRPYVSTGNYVLDALRAHCWAQRITMPQLESFVNAGGYFSARCWSGNRGHISYKYIIRAIHELGGRLQINWPSDE